MATPHAEACSKFGQTADEMRTSGSRRANLSPPWSGFSPGGVRFWVDFLSWDSPQVAAPKEALEVGRNDNAVIALLAASLAWRTGKRHAPATSL